MTVPRGRNGMPHSAPPGNDTPDDCPPVYGTNRNGQDDRDRPLPATPSGTLPTARSRTAVPFPTGNDKGAPVSRRPLCIFPDTDYFILS